VQSAAPRNVPEAGGPSWGEACALGIAFIAGILGSWCQDWESASGLDKALSEERAVSRQRRWDFTPNIFCSGLQ
jgi:hypothetical protein